MDKIKYGNKVVDSEFSTFCDSESSVNKMKQALSSMKKGKLPRIDKLSVELYVHFWKIIKLPLFYIYKEYIIWGDMTASINRSYTKLQIKKY